MKRGTMELIQKSVENDQLKWVNDEMVGTKSFSMFENQVKSVLFYFRTLNSQLGNQEKFNLCTQ